MLQKTKRLFQGSSYFCTVFQKLWHPIKQSCKNKSPSFLSLLYNSWHTHAHKTDRKTAEKLDSGQLGPQKSYTHTHVLCKIIFSPRARLGINKASAAPRAVYSMGCCPRSVGAVVLCLAEIAQSRGVERTALHIRTLCSGSALSMYFRAWKSIDRSPDRIRGGTLCWGAIEAARLCTYTEGYTRFLPMILVNRPGCSRLNLAWCERRLTCTFRFIVLQKTMSFVIINRNDIKKLSSFRCLCSHPEVEWFYLFFCLNFCSRANM